MLNLKFIPYIAERDVDLVLVEEFTVNDEFRDFFSSRAYGIPVFAKSLGSWHSVSDSVLGESDVVHLFQSEEGKRVALLIENKIDAAPQPAQAERYRKRGEKGVTEGLWDEFRTCLVAPKQYIDGGLEAAQYNCLISYEELLSFFASAEMIQSWNPGAQVVKAFAIQGSFVIDWAGRPRFRSHLTTGPQRKWSLAWRPRWGLIR